MKSEFEFINSLAARVKNRFSRTGIGDDCAVIPKNSAHDLVITSDLLVEEIDFKLEWSEPESIGHKALAVSLSDIAAMGGKPVWSMTSLAVPEKIWKSGFVDKFYAGYLALADQFKVELIGGDISKTTDKLVIDSIVAGEVSKGNAVLRSGAKAGDLIFVSGRLGGAAGGLKLLTDRQKSGKLTEIWQKNLLSRQLKPFPQTALGRILGSRKIATSMIDLSDGLSSDLAHVCRASRVGARIFADQIPVDENLSGLTQDFDRQIDLALNGGEDFELLFTVDPKKKFPTKSFIKKYQLSLIGEVTANIETIELIKRNQTMTLQPQGYRHF